jgi:predicted small secreted protein
LLRNALLPAQTVSYSQNVKCHARKHGRNNKGVIFMKTSKFFMRKNKLLVATVIVGVIAVLFVLAACNTDGGNDEQSEGKSDPPDPPSYTVIYDTNGGNGTMGNSTHIIGTAKNLNANTFTRLNYTFMGWAASPTGTVVYTDGQSVNNLITTAEATITLYAVWQHNLDFIPSLAGKLAWLEENAESNTNYTLAINTSETIDPAVLSYSGRTNIGITLVSTGAERNIGLLSNGSLFTVNNGVTLTLDNNITLHGRSSNTDSLIYVNGKGTLVMNTGSRIIDNTGLYDGGGICVSGSGTFTMNGGTISGNTASSGGGVCLRSGTFTMISGTISGNTASFGGGVCIWEGTFTMISGTISGNAATLYVGSSYIGSGGGVACSGTGTFLFSGGTVYGSEVAVAVSIRNKAFSGAALYSAGLAHYGEFIGDIWVNNDNLNTRDTTFRVVDGILQ